MGLTKIVNVDGIMEVNDVKIKINFSHINEEYPNVIQFSFKYGENINIYGMCNKNGVISYNVTGGIIKKEFMDEIEIKCIDILSNYNI